MHWNPKETGSNASEGNDFLVRRRESRQKERKLSSSVTLYRLLSEGVALIKGGSSHLKDPDLK